MRDLQGLQGQSLGRIPENCKLEMTCTLVTP